MLWTGCLFLIFLLFTPSLFLTEHLLCWAQSAEEIVPWRFPQDAEVELLPQESLDPNRAELSDLLYIPGMSNELALLIINDRQVRGPYKDADDLYRIEGVPKATIDRIKPYFTFQPEDNRYAAGLIAKFRSDVPLSEAEESRPYKFGEKLRFKNTENYSVGGSFRFCIQIPVPIETRCNYLW